MYNKRIIDDDKGETAHKSRRIWATTAAAAAAAASRRIYAAAAVI